MPTRVEGVVLPTGIHLTNARELLFKAAEDVLQRDGLGGLTSRAVTDAAGVSKGVMHRHFEDFDLFVADWILDRVARLDATTWCPSPDATVVDNLTAALMAFLTPLAVAVVSIVVTRDGVRDRLRAAGAARIPLLTEGTRAITEYLVLEQSAGRIRANADTANLARMLVGSAHLLFTDWDSGQPPADIVREAVEVSVHDFE